MNQDIMDRRWLVEDNYYEQYQGESEEEEE